MAADPTVDSPPMQNYNRQKIMIDGISEEAHDIYYIDNCQNVYVNSCNTRIVRMQNCGNCVPQPR